MKGKVIAVALGIKRRDIIIALLITVMMAQAEIGVVRANRMGDAPERLPGIPTSASPYSGAPPTAPYLCYPGSDKFYYFPGFGDPWVFNHAMVWMEQKDGVTGPPICYCGGESLWLTGNNQASYWRGGTISQNGDDSTTFSAPLADEGAKLPFFTGEVDPAIAQLAMGHACTSAFQFNLEQYPEAVLEVTDASAPWRFMVVLKGREGKPPYICDWKTGPGKLEIDLRRIYRDLGYQGNFGEVYFLLSVVGEPEKPKTVTFRLRMAGEAAVIPSLPVIRTIQREHQEGVPIECVVLDKKGAKQDGRAVAVKARVNGKRYELQESEGIWKTRIKELPVGDYRAAIEAVWREGRRKKIAVLDVSITDGKFMGFDLARGLLTYDRKPMPPMAGTERGKVIFKQADSSRESLVCGGKEWSKLVAKAKGGKMDVGYRWWEGFAEKDYEQQAAYLASCGLDAMHLSSWWDWWERTEYLDHVTPYGAERLAALLRANRKHGIFLYFNLANHDLTEDCVPYQQQVDAGIKKWSYALDSGWVKTFTGYAAAFARLYRDETSLMAVSADGERDRDTSEGSLEFVNHINDVYRAEDPNHLFITEFDTFENPMDSLAFKPKPYGFRTYTCHDRDQPYGVINPHLLPGKFKVEMMHPYAYEAEGNFWGQLPVALHGYEGDSTNPNFEQGMLLQSPKVLAHFRLLTRDETYMALVYRMPMCLSWGECIIEDERQVHQDVRHRVNWEQEWKPAPLALRVKTVRDKSLEPNLHGCARLIDEPYKYEEKLNALSLETAYLWGNAPVPEGVAHVIDLTKCDLKPAFVSDGGDLPDGLKELRPIVVPGGQVHYSWSRDGRTLLAYLREQTPGSTVKLQGFPDGERLRYRLYDLDQRKAVATGSFQKGRAVALPGKGDSYFLLVAP